MGGVDMWHLGGEKKSSLSSLDWSKTGDSPQMIGARLSPHDKAENVSLFDQPCDLNGFSSSLPALLHEKCELVCFDIDKFAGFTASEIISCCGFVQ